VQNQGTAVATVVELAFYSDAGACVYKDVVLNESEYK